MKKNHKIIRENSIINNEENHTEITNNDKEENFFFRNLYNLTSDLGNNLSKTYDFTLKESEKTLSYSFNFVSDKASSVTNFTKQNFILIKDKVDDRCTKIEIKDKFFILLKLIDIDLVTTVLYKLPAPPPAKITLIAIAQLLSILDKKRKNKENAHDEQNYDIEISKLLKEINFKTAIPILEQYQSSIPYGKQVVFIIKLFK